MRRYIFLVAALMLAVACGDNSNGDMPWGDLGDQQGQNPNPDNQGGQGDGVVGSPLALWSEGNLDIHFINTGRGECAFYILPDGTTLIVDAGELSSNSESNETGATNKNFVPQRPFDGVRPYIVDAKYIKHFLPAGESAIDYCAPSHFHIDHIGCPKAVTETAAAGYRKAGLMALYDQVQFDQVLDRAYPNYTEDASTPKIEGGLAEDWAKFVQWGVREGKFTAKRFTPGEEQIVLLNNKAKYSNFKLLNICANGFVVSKDTTTGAAKVTGEKSGEGNPASCGFHISYGDFDYIACGDLTSTPQNKVAAYFRDFIGSSNLEAFKGHHHLNGNSWGSNMQSCKMNPKVILNQNFYKTSPDPDILNQILNNSFSSWVGSYYLFTTNVHPDAMAENPTLYNRIVGYNGHIVLRVAPGGTQYTVYMLDDTNYDYKVKSVHGPYTSR